MIIHDVVLTPNSVICDNNVAIATGNKDVWRSFANMNLVLQDFFNRFEIEYISALKEHLIYDKNRYNNSTDNLINDIVLVKDERTPRMKPNKAKVIVIIKGIDNRVRGFQLKLFQPSSNRTIIINWTLQIVLPFEINKSEGNETITRHKGMLPINADAKIELISKNVSDSSCCWGECQ